MSAVDDLKRPPPLLVFVHVPKTAGTSLRAILAMNEPGRRVRALPNVFKGGGGLNRDLMEEVAQGQGLLHRRLQALDGVGIMSGHVPYGLHEHLPRYMLRGRKVRWFTFLRDPVDRTLSHYFRVRALRKPAPGVTVPRSRLPEQPALEDLIEAGYLHDNLHTRMLCGMPEPFGEVDDAMLERAKRTLREDMVFVGITERFDESLVLARRRLGLLSVLDAGNARVNAKRPRGAGVPSELLQAAQRVNGHDAELYRYAIELFDAAPELGELDFQVETAALAAARGTGKIATTPAPAGFRGGPTEWRMLLRARAELLRTERPRAMHEELRAARTRVRELEGELKRLRRATREAARRGD